MDHQQTRMLFLAAKARLVRITPMNKLWNARSKKVDLGATMVKMKDSIQMLLASPMRMVIQ